jgi:hypothetical protein
MVKVDLGAKVFVETVHSCCPQIVTVTGLARNRVPKGILAR